MPSSSRRMRSLSAAESSSRARRATCSTCESEIFGWGIRSPPGARNGATGACAQPLPGRPAVEGLAKEETLLGPREADVAEPPLLLQLLRVIHGARVGEDPFLHAREEHGGGLEPPGRVRGPGGDPPG